MANWFKLYETDLDETRMKYAMSKLPETWPVWTAVLMECCKHRSDTFSWGSGEQELFGFSDRLKLSIPKVNAAVNMLCEIKYCQKLENQLKVLKWSEKQGDYLSRQGYWKDRRKSKCHSESQCVTVNHSESHIEERRGEENKRENTEVAAPPAPKASKFQKPSEAEVLLQCAKVGLSDSEGLKFINYYESNGWRVGRNPMKSWTHALTNWKNNSNSYGQTTKPNPRNVGVAKFGISYGEAAKRKLAQQGMAGQVAETKDSPQPDPFGA